MGSNSPVFNMNREDISFHYSTVARHYNNVVYTSTSDSDYQNDVTGLIVHYLHLDSASLVVDLGAGVCTMASKVAKIASLEHPVLCVDPSMEMLEIGKELPGVKTLHMSAEEWAGTKEEDCFDRIYIRGAFHHFNREHLKNTLDGIYKKLKMGGRFLIEKPADRFDCLPYPERVVKLMNQMEIPRSETIELMKQSKFVLVESHRHEFAVEKEKIELFESYRKRLCSGFSMFTDAEIEEGIAEVDEKYSGDIVKYVDQRDFIVGCKLSL